MIRSLLFVHLFTIIACESPPVQVGNKNQYVLAKLNSEINITCPFTDVQFFKWYNFKVPSNVMSEQQTLKIKLNSVIKLETYVCEAVNGFGQRKAFFIAKGIDTSSKYFDIDCHSRETGPCFLAPEESNEFEYTVDSGSNLTMDCRAVMDSSSQDQLKYIWKRVERPGAYDPKMRDSVRNNVVKTSDNLPQNRFPDEKLEPNFIDEMSKWGPLVSLRGVTRNMDAIYQCTVVASVGTIQRSFSIRVREPNAASNIEGPLSQTITVAAGSTQTLQCRANSKPKWGKKLEKSEEKQVSEEIIKWNDNVYRLLQGSLDIEHKANGGSVKDSNLYTNNLRLENVQQHHSGIYVCSVLTPNQMEMKVVNLSVEVGIGISETWKSNNFPIYIAVPTTIFIICLAMVIYCLIQRRIRQKSTVKNRVARGTTVTTTNSSSGNGSCSGSRNTSNPRQQMLTTTTSSSKGSQNQFVPITAFQGNPTSVAVYGPGQQVFQAGYCPGAMPYGPGGGEVEHPCTQHSYMGHSCQAVPYSSDSGPPPPTAALLSDPVMTSYPSYSPNQPSQVYAPNQTPHGSSSTSVSATDPLHDPNQRLQPVYPIGVMYSA